MEHRTHDCVFGLVSVQSGHFGRLGCLEKTASGEEKLGFGDVGFLFLASSGSYFILGKLDRETWIAK